MHTNNPSSTTITKILSISAIIVSLLASGILIGGYQNIGLWSSSSPEGLITLLRDLPQAFLGPLRHADIFHLLGNLMFLWFFGSQLERHIGAYWYLFGYILSISIIHMAFLAFGTRAVGLSGFLMAILSFLAIHLSCLRSKDAGGAWVFLGINVAIGLMANVSLTAHAVGALVGILWYGLWRLSGPKGAKSPPPSLLDT